MHKQFVIGAALLLLGSALVGCSKTAEGVSEDAAKNTAAVKQAGDEVATKTVEGTKAAVDKTSAAAAGAVDATKEAADKAAAATAGAVDKAVDVTKDAADKAAAVTAGAAKGASDALGLTPTVKNAILDVPELRDPAIAKNINVDTANDVVHIKGMVPTNDLKKKAGEAASKAIKDANAKATLSNELTVSGH